jgi:Protein of unknown function (DUF2934)
MLQHASKTSTRPDSPNGVPRTGAPNGELPVPVAQSAAEMTVPDDAIAKRAYEKFEARGHIHGFDQEDWATARRELIAEDFGQ